MFYVLIYLTMKGAKTMGATLERDKSDCEYPIFDIKTPDFVVQNKNDDHFEENTLFEPVQNTEKLEITESFDTLELFKRDLHYKLSSSNIESTREFNDELFKRRAAGENVTDEIVLANVSLVMSIANKFRCFAKSMEFNDLVNIGILGLYTAIERYDINFGVAFSTYAYYWIRQFIQREISNNDLNCHVPVYILDIVRNYNKFKTEYELLHGCDPTWEIVQKELDITDEQLFYIQQATSIDSMKSLNERFSNISENGSDDEIGDYLVDSKACIDKDLLDEELSDVLLDVVERFISKRTPEDKKARTRDIIYRRFGIGYATEPETYPDIANDLGVSKQAIQQKVSAFLKFAQEDLILRRYMEDELNL